MKKLLKTFAEENENGPRKLNVIPVLVLTTVMLIMVLFAFFYPKVVSRKPKDETWVEIDNVIFPVDYNNGFKDGKREGRDEVL